MGAFEIARRMAEQGQSWGSIDPVLEVYVIEMAKYDIGWSWL
jgi:hypothetical protein